MSLHADKIRFTFSALSVTIIAHTEGGMAYESIFIQLQQRYADSVHGPAGYRAAHAEMD